MANRERYSPKTQTETETFPFENAEEAWFWFIQAMQARAEGARFTQGLSLYPRPCEPMDILKLVERLHRQRRLLMDHVLVLRHYGKRLLPPDPYRAKEMRAHKLWHEALDRLEPVLINKGIIREQRELFLEAAE